MQRNWTKVGAETVERAGGRENVEAAIAGLEWTTETRVAFMPGAAINATIEQLAMPRIGRIAIGAIECPSTNAEEDGFYPGFYGIECSYSNGFARVYVLDTGTSIDVACSDFFARDGGEIEKLRGRWVELATADDETLTDLVKITGSNAAAALLRKRAHATGRAVARASS